MSSLSSMPSSTAAPVAKASSAAAPVAKASSVASSAASSAAAAPAFRFGGNIGPRNDIPREAAAAAAAATTPAKRTVAAVPKTPTKTKRRLRRDSISTLDPREIGDIDGRLETDFDDDDDFPASGRRIKTRKRNRLHKRKRTRKRTRLHKRKRTQRKKHHNTKKRKIRRRSRKRR